MNNVVTDFLRLFVRSTGVSAMLLLSNLLRAQGQQPLVVGLDHIPMVVTDLESAQADFRAMGFAIKPGRFHADGIRNVHVKFPDGSEIELITADKATDELTAEYRRKMEKGEGAVYFGLYAPYQDAVVASLNGGHVAVQNDNGILTFASASPLHPLFLGKRNKTSSDMPKHFAHQNGATRLSGLWVRDSPELRTLLRDLGIPLTRTNACGLLGINEGIRASLPEGDLYLVRSDTASVIAARVDVRKLADVEALLKASRVPIKRDSSCDKQAVWVGPEKGHGIWIEFAATDASDRTGTPSP